jgi:hypothetical protein
MKKRKAMTRRKAVAKKSADPATASQPESAEITLENANRRIRALEIVVRRLAKDDEINVTNFAAYTIQNNWLKSELDDLLR